MKHFVFFSKSMRYTNANEPSRFSKEQYRSLAMRLFFITANMLVLNSSIFAQQLLEIQARPSTGKSDIGSQIEKSLTKYDTYQMDSRAIYAHATRNEDSSFALNISFGEDRKLEMILEPSKVHESDFSFLTNTSQRIEVEKNITYKGYLKNAPEIKVRMTIAEHYIAGYIMEKVPFTFETPYNKEKQVITDKVIAYTSADYLNAQESACGHDTENGGYAIPEINQPSQNASGKPAPKHKNAASNAYCPKLSIVLDHQGLAVAGSIAKFNTDIQTIVNIVNGYYDDFSVEYKLNPVHFISSAPNPWTDSPRNEAQLTSNFRNWAYPNLTPNDYNCALLFTGTDMRGIGYAYYGHMCPGDSYRYGEIDYRYAQPITQRANLTAHELGHLWGALHVPRSSIHLMSPTIYDGTLQWGSTSYNYIYNAVNNTYKSCLPQCTVTGGSCNAPYTDIDNDGYCSDVDCNDTNAAIKPGAVELCDGIDNNCNGQIDEGVLIIYYRDADNDGYGNASQSTQSCSLPVGYVTNNTDCNDANAAIKPGAVELCDGIDNNCNGQIDEMACGGDGYCTPIHMRRENELITNVTLSNINNASGGWNTSTTGYSDYTNLVAQVAIGGTYTITVTPNFSFPYSKVGIWADWNQNFIFDSGEQIASFSGQGPWTASFSPPVNAILGTTRLRVRLQYGSSYVPDPCAYSNYYSGETEDYSLEVMNCINQTYYRDADNDGYGNASQSIQSCSLPVGYVTNNTDCNDSSAAINPDAVELCDGIDNNCNGQIDEGVLKTYYADSDNDGYGNAGQSIQACSAPAGYVTNNTDCNDSNAAIKPGVVELCDGIDNNCNGQIDEMACGGGEYCTPIHMGVQHELITNVTFSNINNTSGGWNTSTIGYSDYTNLVAQMAIGNTYTITVTPNFSFPDSKVGIWADWNQNFVFDAGEQIASFSGQGPWTASFTPPANTVLGTTRLRVRLQYSPSYVPDPCAYSYRYSGETEDYSLQVVNCISQTYYADADQDGYGNASQSIQSCSTPVGYVTNNTDCNDSNAAIKPGAVELCDGIDNNCNGQIDEMACGGGEYCTPIHMGVQHELITNVTLSNINNTSGGWNTSTTGYSDYTNLVAQVAIGGTYTITVTPNFSFPDSKVGIWADWNQNFVFDAGEQIASFSGTGPWTASFTPPANAVLGTTRLRVRLQYSPSYVPDPCAYSYRYSGETEDYSLQVVNQMNKSYFADAYSEERYDLQLYPNPNFTPDLVVDVKSPEAVKEIEVRLLDVYGKVIRMQKVDQVEAGSNKIRIETADLPAGAYFIKIIGIDQLQRPRMFIRSGS